MNRHIQLLCTLGPSTLNGASIGQLDEAGVSLFRLNLSHTALEDVERLVDLVHSSTEVPLCIDSEGAQVRTGAFTDGEISVTRHSQVILTSVDDTAQPGDVALYPRSAFDAIGVGDIVSADFRHAHLQIVEDHGTVLVARALSDGVIGSNKAVVVDRTIPLPNLTEKDRAAVVLAGDLGVRHFALSFADSAAAVDELRALVPEGSSIISKIESLQGLQDLEAIADASDALLIDRGDLSSHVHLEYIPRVQKHILSAAAHRGTPVNVATNLLESMVTQRSPTRAEVNDIYHSVVDGASGLVLAAETAIGHYPVRCARMVRQVVSTLPETSEADLRMTEAAPLPTDPTTYSKVRSDAWVFTVDQDDLLGLRRVPQPESTLLDCEQLAQGTYSPLAGFLGREELESVLTRNRLPDGSAWSLPIILAVDPEVAGSLAIGDRIVLTDTLDRAHSVVDIEEIYEVDPLDVAERWFGTVSERHPGAASFLAGGRHFLAGPVTRVTGANGDTRPHVFTPFQARALFRELGWSKVLGFHSRNPMHRGHEAAQVLAFQESGADGILLHPVIGPKKPGDFTSEAIVHSYLALLESGHYDIDEAVFGCLAVSSRYSGPREAIFTALCRKNFGCTHFVIGRDHTGVSTFYEGDAVRRAFDQVGDIGIAPVFVDEIGYDPGAGQHRVATDGVPTEPISGTAIRNALLEQRTVPEWMMRSVVQEAIMADVRAGTAIVPTEGSPETL